MLEAATRTDRYILVYCKLKAQQPLYIGSNVGGTDRQHGSQARMHFDLEGLARSMFTVNSYVRLLPRLQDGSQSKGFDFVVLDLTERHEFQAHTHTIL